MEKDIVNDGDRLILNFDVYLPNEFGLCKELVTFDPLRFTRPAGDFCVSVRERKQRKIRVLPDYILQVNVTSSVKSVKECGLIEQIESEIEELVYRFFRLLRRKIPKNPFNLPKDLLSGVSYNWEELKAHWHILGMREVLIQVTPQDITITEEQWSEMEEELASEKDTEIWEDFLLDSKTALREDDLNRATLYAAIACETFIKSHIKLMASTHNISDKFIRFIDGQEPDIRAIRYYGPILHLITGHSLEDEKRELYRSLEHIMKRRNKIMHEGRRLFNKEERTILANDIRNAEHAISWVQSLLVRSKS